MEWVEPVAAAFGLLAVVLVVRQNIWCWPTGLIQVALYVFVFFQVKLYSDVILHMIYVVVQIYGWYHWLHGGADQGELPVSRLSLRALTVWIALALAGTVVWGRVMSVSTDAAIPYGDAFTTATSLIAMWLQARKRIETWAFWIAVDVVAIGIYYIKELYWTSGLYVVFLALCVIGLLSWQHSLRERAA
ncbi:MAG: nicotinamide riboside transporter PnuC [Gammaproteobacteria bacterium]|nr:nicotinamide riboside transporter PnuC [Gammaproteobacteria bacterium]